MLVPLQMPYRATNRRQRRRRPRRATKGRGVTKAVRAYVKRVMPKTELKRIVSYADEVALSTLVQGTALPQIGVTQGLQLWNRTGNEIRVKGFHFKGIMTNTATTPNYVRVVVAWTPMDTDTSFSSVNIFGDITLAGLTGGISTIPGLNIMYYPINKLQFTPVHDKIYKLGGSGDPSCSRMYSRFIKMNKAVKFIANSTGTGTQNWQLTMFYFVAEAGDDTMGGQTIEVSHVSRTFFTDA